MSGNQLAESGQVRKIVVATDGSAYSDGSIRVGLAYGQRLQAEVFGLSVVIHSPEFETFVPNLEELSAQRAQEALLSFHAAAGQDAATIVLKAGDPAEGIVEGASQAGADMIVIGRRGKRGLARSHVGDATVKVIGRAACPVLVVPQIGQLWSNRILLATDGSECSVAAAEAAGNIARQSGLPITVVSVVTSSHSDTRRNAAQEAVDSKVAKFTEMGLQVDGKVLEGQPDEAIVRAVGETGADLVVMGSHGRTGLKKILMGSVSERVIGQVACPVLVVKP
ncbi:MAG: universal stress protein [Thiobacillus sp.]|nr:universal stress protein [Thiobacillus sp.]